MMDVAIRDAMVPGEAGAFFETIRAIGVNAIEIEVDARYRTPRILKPDGEPYSVLRASDARELKSRLEHEGVRPSALLIANDFSGGDPLQLVWASAAAAGAAWLGAPVLRIDPLALDKTIPSIEVAHRFGEAIRLLVRELLAPGVDLGIENHGPMANEPAFLDMLLNQTGNPRVGVTLDTGNFYWFGFPLEEVYGLIERYAPRAKHTHLKSINYPPADANRRREIGYEYKQQCCALHEGNLDLGRVVKIFRDAGYDRDLCIEDESLFKHAPADRVAVLRREVNALREALV